MQVTPHSDLLDFMTIFCLFCKVSYITVADMLQKPNSSPMKTHILNPSQWERKGTD